MNNLRALRELRGLKQLAVATDLGIKSSVSISEWETGRKGLSVENAIMFSRYYGVTVGCIVGTEPIPEGYPTSYLQPAFYHDMIKEQQQAEDPPRSFRPNKAPFTTEQMDYLEDWGDRLTEKIVDSLKEDTSLLKETGTTAK